MKELKALFAQSGFPGIIDESKEPELISLQTYAKLYLTTRDRNKELEAKKILLLEHTINLLDANEKSSSCNFFNWEDSTNTLFGKPGNSMDNCLSSLKKACSSLQKGEEMMESINNHLYSQAFRKACAYGAVEVINILLQHKSLLNNFDINEPSSNGKTALDWIKKATINNKTKESLVEKFIRFGAVSGEQIKLESMAAFG